MKTPFCEVYVARGFCRLKPLETRPNVCLTIITPCNTKKALFPKTLEVDRFEAKEHHGIPTTQ